jgi:hypothetical protein
VHAASEASFLLWRLQRGNYIRGFRSRIRRARRKYDDRYPGDTVEYHAVRDGVDEIAITRLLSPRFASVSVIKYWSTWLSSIQTIGERAGVANTFQVIADDRLAPRQR